MGDRRKGDRRAPEEGVIRIQKKKMWIYVVLIGVLVFAIVLNIISWSNYIKYRKQYDTLVDNYYNDNSINDNIENTSNIENNNDYTCEISINGDKKSVKAGETITYELKASDINAGEGIKTFEAYIDYDTNIFDCKVESDDKGEWSRTGLLEGYLTMDKSNFEASSEDQVIAKITFKAKDGISEGSYQVKLTNIKFTTGDNQVFEVADNTLDIKVD